MPLRGLRIALVLVGMTLTACALQPASPVRTSLPPLPDVNALACCWQSEEQVQVTRQGSTQSLHTVVAVTEGLLTVVMLDPTGRRLLTLRYDSESGLVELGKPPGWDSRFSTLLLAAIFLHHQTSGPWPAGGSGWTVRTHGGEKTLFHHNRAVMGIRYADDGAGQTRILEMPGSEITLEVTTLNRTTL